MSEEAHKLLATIQLMLNARWLGVAPWELAEVATYWQDQAGLVRRLVPPEYW